MKTVSDCLKVLVNNVINHGETKYPEFIELDLKYVYISGKYKFNNLSN